MNIEAKEEVSVEKAAFLAAFTANGCARIVEDEAAIDSDRLARLHASAELYWNMLQTGLKKKGGK